MVSSSATWASRFTWISSIWRCHLPMTWGAMGGTSKRRTSSWLKKKKTAAFSKHWSLLLKREKGEYWDDPSCFLHAGKGSTVRKYPMTRECMDGAEREVPYDPCMLTFWMTSSSYEGLGKKKFLTLPWSCDHAGPKPGWKRRGNFGCVFCQEKIWLISISC